MCLNLFHKVRLRSWGNAGGLKGLHQQTVECQCMARVQRTRRVTVAVVTGSFLSDVNSFCAKSSFLAFCEAWLDILEQQNPNFLIAKHCLCQPYWETWVARRKKDRHEKDTVKVMAEKNDNRLDFFFFQIYFALVYSCTLFMLGISLFLLYCTIMAIIYYKKVA